MHAVLIDPITSARPSNSDLAKGINQIHVCFEEHKRVTKRSQTLIGRKAEAARKEAKAARAEVTAIRQALGITPGQKKVAGLSTPFKAFIRSVGAAATAMGGLVLLYRFAIAVAPKAWSFLLALNHVILDGKF